MLERKTVSQCVSADYCRGWNDAVGEMPKWISVEERLPDGGAMVIAHTLCFYDVLQWDAREELWVGAYSVHVKNYVTHWMPLPPAQEDEKC